MPPKGRKQLLHEGHPGISRMKGIARSVVWWAGLSQNIEEVVKDCTQCQQHQKAPAPAPLHPWEWPDGPWSRLHIDHAGPFLRKYFIVLMVMHIQVNGDCPIYSNITHGPEVVQYICNTWIARNCCLR